MTADPDAALRDHHAMAWENSFDVACDHSWERDGCPGCEHDRALAATASPGLGVEMVYAAVRPEFRDSGPGNDTWDPDAMARAAAERIHARLAATASPGLDDNAEFKSRFWVYYRCGMVGCQTVEPHEHGGGQPMREMTPEERAALAADRETPEGWTLKEVRE